MRQIPSKMRLHDIVTIDTIAPDRKGWGWGGGGAGGFNVNFLK